MRNSHHITDPEKLAWTTLEGAGIGVFRINMQTDEMEYSRTFSRLLSGNEAAPFTRADFTGRVRPEDKILRQAAYAEMLRTGRFHYEPKVIWNDGTVHRLSADGSCNFDETGKPLMFTGIVKDITNEKDNDSIERDWEMRFSNIIEQSPIATCLLRGPNLIIEIVNKHMLALVDEDNSIIGKPLNEAIPELEKQGYIDAIELVLQSGKPQYGIEMPAVLNRNKYPDQIKHIYLNCVFSPFTTPDGKIDGVVVTASEVTSQVVARRKIEEADIALRGAIELAKLGTWEVDITNRTMFFSERLKEWLGFDQDEIVTYENAISQIAVEDRPLIASAFMHAVNAETDNIFDVECTVYSRKSEEKRILHAMGKAFLNEKGEAFRVRGTVQDVTAQRTLQLALEQEVQKRTEELQTVNEQLMATNEELEQLNENLIYSNTELQQFAHVASHDLKEPLRKIKTFLSRIEVDEKNTLTEKSLVFMSKVHIATDRMFSMIEGVLNYSTVNAGEHKYQKIDLNTIFSDILVDLEILISQKQASVHFNNLPVIDGAYILIYQLFYNLIANSLKFSRPGQPSVISIQSEITHRNNISFAEIRLIDNGIGFDEAESEKIFNTFTRLNSKDQFEGTGLGLALCKRIVLRHGGNIHATGKRNEGAVFIVSLPIKHAGGFI